jgi:hypothetical protein
LGFIEWSQLGANESTKIRREGQGDKRYCKHESGRSTILAIRIDPPSLLEAWVLSLVT